MSTEQPRTCRAAIASSVSRARSPPAITEGPSLSAASTKARLVIDFDPGGRTRALTGPPADGACQVLITSERIVAVRCGVWRTLFLAMKCESTLNGLCTAFSESRGHVRSVRVCAQAP
jgi:hypothetical protein